MSMNSDQQMLEDSARQFFAERSPTAAVRSNRAAGRSFDPDIWHEIAELGFAGALIPETYGGSGIGYRGLGVVLDAAGRSLAASPLLQSAFIGAAAILRHGSPEQQASILPRIASGELTLALAVDEHAHHRPEDTRTRARRVGDQWILDGRKRLVADGDSAALLLTLARVEAKGSESDRLQWFLVPAATAGVTRQRRHMVDGEGFADIEFAAVELGQHTALGGAWQDVLDIACIGVASTMQGAAEAALALTLDHLKTRSQFGQLIGSFQALQHRVARLYVDLQLSRAAVTAALDALDAHGEANADGRLQRLASLCKALCGETLHDISNDTVQLHGGIGMTDVHDSGLFLKRARVLETLYGSSSHHRDRYAHLLGL
ncbi:MAG: acyl-CoA dehydrogenase [Sinobacteraceae bacterium]|nr:acyl-CoA dehydrogenase [Nevskiaceae bacterium]